MLRLNWNSNSLTRRMTPGSRFVVLLWIFLIWGKRAHALQSIIRTWTQVTLDTRAVDVCAKYILSQTNHWTFNSSARECSPQYITALEIALLIGISKCFFPSRIGRGGIVYTFWHTSLLDLHYLIMRWFGLRSKRA